MPQVPAKDWEEVKKFMREEFTAETIIEMYLPIYSRHFTAQEVKQLIAFYQSPVGRKWMKLIGTRSVMAARIVCLLLTLLVVALVTGVSLLLLNKESLDEGPGRLKPVNQWRR